jgi:DNA-binding phage protein
MFWAILEWMDDSAGVRDRFRFLEAVLDERSRRLLAAAESKVWGAGGISAVSRAAGVARQVIRQGLKELSQPPAHPAGRIRRPGGGRKKAKYKDELARAASHQPEGDR